MKRVVSGLAAWLLFLGGAAEARGCPECRARVSSGVYGPDFTATLFVMLLPTAVLILIGVAVYYADDIRDGLKARTARWQTGRSVRR